MEDLFPWPGLAYKRRLPWQEGPEDPSLLHDLLWQATVSFGHARSCLHVGSETCRTPAEHLQKPAEHLHMTQPPTNSDQHTNSGEAHVRQPLILAVTAPDCAVWGKESATLESDGLKITASQHNMLEAQDQACSQTQELSPWGS